MRGQQPARAARAVDQPHVAGVHVRVQLAVVVVREQRRVAGGRVEAVDCYRVGDAVGAVPAVDPEVIRAVVLDDSPCLLHGLFEAVDGDGVWRFGWRGHRKRPSAVTAIAEAQRSGHLPSGPPGASAWARTTQCNQSGGAVSVRAC